MVYKLYHLVFRDRPILHMCTRVLRAYWREKAIIEFIGSILWCGCTTFFRVIMLMLVVVVTGWGGRGSSSKCGYVWWSSFHLKVVISEGNHVGMARRVGDYLKHNTHIHKVRVWKIMLVRQFKRSLTCTGWWWYTFFSLVCLFSLQLIPYSMIPDFLEKKLFPLCCDMLGCVGGAEQERRRKGGLPSGALISRRGQSW